jgi:outer membrane murein-binding lipoprotein Lpp
MADTTTATSSIFTQPSFLLASLALLVTISIGVVFYQKSTQYDTKIAQLTTDLGTLNTNFTNKSNEVDSKIKVIGDGYNNIAVVQRKMNTLSTVINDLKAQVKELTETTKFLEWQLRGGNQSTPKPAPRRNVRIDPQPQEQKPRSALKKPLRPTPPPEDLLDIEDDDPLEDDINSFNDE